MKLGEFLRELLLIHGEVLKNLSAVFGKTVLVEILEAAGEREDLICVPYLDFFESDNSDEEVGGAYYESIQVGVESLKLPPELAFHCWAFPIYRAYVESELPLNANLKRDSDSEIKLFELTNSQIEGWLRSLALPEKIHKSAAKAVFPTWLRLRTKILESSGQPVLKPVN